MVSVSKKTWSSLPGKTGLPFVGDTFKLLNDPIDWADNRLKSYGDVSKCVVFGQRAMLMVGPEANQFVLKDSNQIFSSVLAYEPFLKDLFPGTLGVKDFEDHARHRRILQSAFHKSSLVGYVDLLNELTASQVSSLPVASAFKSFVYVKDLLLEQAALLFLGQTLDEEARRLGKLFLNLVSASTAVLRIPGSWTTYGRGLKAKEELWSFLLKELPNRRASSERDLFSHVARAESEEGERLSDDEVVGHMLGFLSAAHDTNASAITSLLYALGKYPDLQESVRAELQAVGPDAPNFETLKDLALTGDFYREVLRVWGPSTLMPRGTLKEFEYQGYVIPKGTMVYLAPAATHRMEERWRDPHIFDPSRFAKPREEHKAHRFLFMPYGGGPHGCLGMVLADMQAKVFCWHLLTRYRVELAYPERAYELEFMPMPMPRDKLPIRLTKLGTS